MKRDTHRLALAAMLSALGAVLLCLGGILPLSTYACPVLASLAVAAAWEECGGKYGFGCYAVTAAIALLLSPDKEAAALFAFLGYYPLLKPRLDALRPAALRAAAKLALCAVAVGAMYALLIFLLRLEALTRELADTAPALLLATVALGLATFLVYDLALGRLTAVYRRRRKHR